MSVSSGLSGPVSGATGITSRSVVSGFDAACAQQMLQQVYLVLAITKALREHLLGWMRT